jgi:hypothetical protein
MKFYLKTKSFILFMNCLYFVSKRNNICGEQGAAKLGEGISKLIIISNLTLNLG